LNNIKPTREVPAPLAFHPQIYTPTQLPTTTSIAHIEQTWHQRIFWAKDQYALQSDPCYNDVFCATKNIAILRISL
jgi:hypothetical protein